MQTQLPFKISTLIYFENSLGELLLLKRKKSPNLGLWSPIGGKLEMGLGESPFEAARRETLEEVGISLSDSDLHLFSMISEKNYEDKMHWMMFMFHSRKPIDVLPKGIDEGDFGFFAPKAIKTIPVPKTDRQSLWPIYFNHKKDFVMQRANCETGKPIEFIVEQLMISKE